MPIEVDSTLVIPDAEIQWKFSPSGGPGGQHANRSSTRAELTWHVAESVVLSNAQRDRLTTELGPIVRIAADDTRSQTRNREIAEQRLAERCREALVEVRRRRSTRPTGGSRRRRLAEKRRHSETKRLRRPPSRDD